MDGSTTSFRTPSRILIPKLVLSRDGWKSKANLRKKKLKAARIHIRDLQNSRAQWKLRSSEATTRATTLQQQLDQARQELAAARDEIARLETEAKKK
jgi:chromosome segregation ATPase